MVGERVMHSQAEKQKEKLGSRLPLVLEPMWPASTNDNRCAGNNEDKLKNLTNDTLMPILKNIKYE